MSSSASTLLSKPEDTKPTTVKGWIESSQFKAQVALGLPKHLTPDRFIRVALTTLLMQPKLAECHPASVLNCLLKCSQYGIEADGRRAHLIPFKNTKENRTDCQLILDYKGIAELVRRSGQVSVIHADIVCENDEWVFSYGSNSTLRHVPALKDRGDVICAYSFVKLKDGSEDWDVMNFDELLDVRDNSQGYKTAVKYNSSNSWIDHEAEMMKKTVFRRHSKWLPLSPEIRDAVESNDDIIPASTHSQRADAAKPVFPVDLTPLVPETPVAEAPAALPPPETPALIPTKRTRARAPKVEVPYVAPAIDATPTTATVATPAEGKHPRLILTERLSLDGISETAFEATCRKAGLIGGLANVRNIGSHLASEILARYDELAAATKLPVESEVK